MANLTVSIEDQVLQRARIRALESGTSVNALVREYLEAYAGANPTREAMAALVQLAETTRSGSGRRGRTWTREDAHAR